MCSDSLSFEAKILEFRGEIEILGQFFNFLLNKSSKTLSFEANMLSFEPKKLSFQQKLALSFVFLEFFVT